MKYIPSIAFEEMSGETSVPMQTMVKWAQTEADPDPDEP